VIFVVRRVLNAPRNGKARVCWSCQTLHWRRWAFGLRMKTRPWLHLSGLFGWNSKYGRCCWLSRHSWLLIGLWPPGLRSPRLRAHRVILRDHLPTMGLRAISLVNSSSRFGWTWASFSRYWSRFNSWIFLWRLSAYGGKSGRPIARRELGGRISYGGGLGERARRLGMELERRRVRKPAWRWAFSGGRHGGTKPGVSEYKIFPSPAASIAENQVIEEIVFAVGSERLAEHEEVSPALRRRECVRTRVCSWFFPHVKTAGASGRVGSTRCWLSRWPARWKSGLLLKRVIDIVIGTVGDHRVLPFMWWS